MPKKFSRQLVERIIHYFKQVRGVEITPDQAEEFLDSLADFYLRLTD